MTVTAGAYPNDWFFGIAITVPELWFQLTTGPPFLVPLNLCGDVVVGPYGGLPPGLTLYAVTLGAPPGSMNPTVVTAPATGTVP